MNFNILKILLILFLFNAQIDAIFIFILLIQDKFTKTNILNLYSSGLFLNYQDITINIERLTKLLLIYYVSTQIKSF